jgi:hypothetical protein
MNTPYDAYRNTKEWILIQKVIQDLMDNQDIQLITHQDYVVGYISKQLIDNSKAFPPDKK